MLGESHLGLRVTDLDRSARFYVEVVVYEVGRAGLHHLAFALGSAEEVDDAAVWLDQHNVRRKKVRPGFTPGSRFVTFYDPDGIPCEYYYMDAAYADLYGMEVSAG
ncbi:MAG TPA: VOC family protein [Dehalococcoidia bacterium]